MELDLRSLAVSRITLGLLVIVDCIFRLQDFQAHYTDAGVMPLSLLDKHYTPTGPCLQCISSNPLWSIVLFVVLMASAAAMSVGWKTRFTTFLTWFLTISVQYRNPLVIDGGDVLLRCFLFWLIFLPTAKVWSYDSAFKKAADLTSPTIRSWTFITLPGQMFLLYFFSALLKSGSDWWPDGTATWYALSLEAFTTSFGKWLRQFPDFLKVVSRSVYLLEMWSPFFLIAPGLFRAFGVLVLIAFHASLAMGLDLALFPWIAFGCLFALMPTEGWTFAATHFPKQIDIKKHLVGARRFLALTNDEYAFSWIAIPFFAAVIGWNILSYRKIAMYEPLRRTVLYAHLDQYWGMFAPYPLKDSGWFEFGIKQWDGDYVYTFVDPRMEEQWDAEKLRPIQGNKFFVDQRWRKYLVNIWEKSNSKFRPGLANYLCGEWNASAETPSEQAVSVDIDFELIQNKEYLGPTREPSSVDLGTYPCSHQY